MLGFFVKSNLEATVLMKTCFPDIPAGIDNETFVKKAVGMKLLPVTSDDLDLYVSMFCNEQHMAGLGGAYPEEKVS